MKKLIYILLLSISVNSFAQLNDHGTNGLWYVGATANFVTIKNKAGLNPAASKIGTYFGIGGQLYYDSYNAGGMRYHLDMKWVPDLGYKAVELFRGVGTDIRLDFTGFTQHKIGMNIIGTDLICFGIGGSFSDYIVDIPHTDQNTQVTTRYNWKEPSGWHWTAGPAVFLDAGVGDFTFNFLMSYEISYLQPKVTDDYEALTDKIAGYNKPHFVQFDFSINHESGLFMSFDRTMMIDKGTIGSKVSRGDLQIGYKFMI